MILDFKPTNNLLKTTYEESYQLQLLGYIPFSRDKEFVYFRKSALIEQSLKEIRNEKK